MIILLDNFYTNPFDAIELAQDAQLGASCGTGKRSAPLQQISPQLYEEFCNGIFNIHRLDPSKFFVHTYFMEHTYNDIDVFNHGWAHVDGKFKEPCIMGEGYNLAVCGQIFLTPDADIDTGVTIYKHRKG